MLLLNRKSRPVRAFLFIGTVFILAVWFLNPKVLSFAHSPLGKSVAPSSCPCMPNPSSLASAPSMPEDETLRKPKPSLSLPEDYLKVPSEPPFCANRFGIQYLENLRDAATEYCTPESASGITCFHSQTVKSRVDSLCIGRNAVFDPEDKVFHLGCELSDTVQSNTRVPAPEWGSFESYMYETGPGVVLDSSLRLDGKDFHDNSAISSADAKYTVLIKREGEGNLWHCLVEIFSAVMTMDVLQMSQRPHGSSPFFTPADKSNTQVVFLDDRTDGPYIDLWSILGTKPIRRLNELPKEEARYDNIIVPLAGGGNPLWEHVWEIHSCEDSALVRTFASRVLNVYDIPSHNQPREGSQIIMTFIDRASTRVLVNHQEYFEEIKSSFPHVTIESVDFAAIPFSEQLKVLRQTDILVGVHGAGMTHGIFLRPRSTMVEILPPDLNFKGFRNIASLMGHTYVRAHASPLPRGGSRKDWHGEDVFIEKDHFMEVMDVAIKSMYNRGERDYDAD